MTNADAIKEIQRWLDGCPYKDVKEAFNLAIKSLEERPQGEWVRTGQSFVNPNKFRNFCCSNCFWELDEHIRVEPNFCPNCGADMRGTNNG